MRRNSRCIQYVLYELGYKPKKLSTARFAYEHNLIII